jgi:PAS domain S-box-containing protein
MNSWTPVLSSIAASRPALRPSLPGVPCGRVFDPLRQLRDLWTPADLTERPAVFVAQVRALTVGVRTAAPFAVVVAAFLMWGLWGFVPTASLLGWLAVLMSSSLMRMWILRYAPKPVAVDHRQTLRAYRYAAGGVLAAGVVWGSAAVMLYAPDNHERHQYLALILAGVCSGAAGTVGPRLQLAVAFMALALGPFALHLALDPGEVDGSHLRLTLLVVMYFVGMTLVARNVARGVKDNEELRLRSEADATALAAERNRFFAMFESLPDPLTVLDQDRRIVHVNRAFETTFGWEAGDAIGRVPDFVLPDPQAWAAIGQVLRQGLLAGSQPPLELVFLTRDGRHIECEVSVRRVSDLSGGPALYLVRAHDVTERKRIARMKDRFISTVSHELRTPLTSLAGSIRLLSHLGPGSEQGKELVVIAQRNSDRLLSLVNDVLDLNRMTSGRLLLEPRDADVKAMVDDALRSIGPFAQELKVPLQASVPAGLSIHVDPHRFEQVLINLVSNACKFSPEGTPVVVTGERFENRIRITVHDRGPGIPPEHLEAVFETFVQVHSVENRRQGGSGLGLAISKALTEQMGGSIGLDSEVGVGTRFWLEFDAREATDAA